MIDLHSHLLPGVDDGSESPEQSVAVLKKFGEQGVTVLCCTPHLKASELEHAPSAEMDQLLGELSAMAPAPPKLVRGFEIMLDTPRGAFGDRRLNLAGTRYVLVEFGRLLPADASVEAISHIRKLGLRPVLAHPERYSTCNPENAQRWKDAGAVLQLDATTFTTTSRRAERARVLLTLGLGDIVASDNHGDTRSVATAVEWLESHGGSEQARLLANDNPAAILADRDTRPVPPLRIRRSWYSTLKAFVVGGREM
ncbi:MAG: tyrosine-protein phosphatase [Gemmatimonadales bacterium]